MTGDDCARSKGDGDVVREICVDGWEDGGVGRDGADGGEEVDCGREGAGEEAGTGNSQSQFIFCT